MCELESGLTCKTRDVITLTPVRWVRTRAIVFELGSWCWDACRIALDPWSSRTDADCRRQTPTADISTFASGAFGRCRDERKSATAAQQHFI